MPAPTLIDVWKMLAATFGGALLTGAGIFFHEANTHATKEDLKATKIELQASQDLTKIEMLRTLEQASPYVRDKGTIFTRLDSIDSNLRELKDLVKESRK